MLSDPRNVEEQSAANVFEASPLPSNAESLARKPSDDEVVRGYVCGGNGSEVAAVDIVA